MFAACNVHITNYLQCTRLLKLYIHIYVCLRYYILTYSVAGYVAILFMYVYIWLAAFIVYYLLRNVIDAKYALY